MKKKSNESRDTLPVFDLLTGITARFFVFTVERIKDKENLNKTNHISHLFQFDGFSYVLVIFLGLQKYFAQINFQD